MSSQFFAPRGILPTFRLDTSNDRPASANGGAVAQILPVRASAPAVARFSRWFRCPPVCQRAGLGLAQLRVPAPRDSLTLPHFSDKTQAWALGTRSQISGKDSLSMVAWRLEEGPELESFGHFSKTFVGVRDRLSHPCRLTTSAPVIHPKNAIKPAPEVAYKTSPEP